LEPEIDFREADRRYADLKRRYDNGDISAEQFRTQLEQTMVQDPEGRWWAKHRETGEWNYHDGSSWVRGTPPGYKGVAREAATDGPPARPSATLHPEVERGENRRRRSPWLLVAGLAGVVALIAVVFSLAAGNAGGPKTAEVPDVVGKPRSEAEKTLKSAGFGVQAEVRESAAEDAGKVIRQSPSGGDAKKGSEVAITVGEGPPEEKNTPVEASNGPAAGYNLIETPDGSLSAEVPQSWGVETGVNSEKKGAKPGTWSYHAGEYLYSSITTAPNLDAWYSTVTTGAYFVASKALAQYSDYELTHRLGGNVVKNVACEEAGPYDDYGRGPLSGKKQTWHGCGPDGATAYALAAYPEGRECVVALIAKITDEAGREAIEHLVNTVEVDCGLVTSGPLAASSSSASASASATASP
jgi:hypothetical protein